jgi:hypothetical protein
MATAMVPQTKVAPCRHSRAPHKNATTPLQCWYDARGSIAAVKPGRAHATDVAQTGRRPHDALTQNSQLVMSSPPLIQPVRSYVSRSVSHSGCMTSAASRNSTARGRQHSSGSCRRKGALLTIVRHHQSMRSVPSPTSLHTALLMLPPLKQCYCIHPTSQQCTWLRRPVNHNTSRHNNKPGCRHPGDGRQTRTMRIQHK